jgi:release factor glutamine methyltransferase
MDLKSTAAPLVMRLQLTEEQRRQIQERTGLTIPAVPVETDAPFLRCRFGGVDLRVVRGVFVPTPSTERLLRLALDVVSSVERPVMTDVGTGSGAVGLAIANRLPNATVYATDISPIALRCARLNRERLNLRNVQFRLGSLLTPLPRRLRGRTDVITANVPYVPPRMTDAFKSGFPEGTAIGFGEDGLGLPRQLADAARDFLSPGGSLLFQLAGFQWKDFGPELQALGYDAPQLDGGQQNAPMIGRAVWRGAPRGLGVDDAPNATERRPA